MKPDNRLLVPLAALLTLLIPSCSNPYDPVPEIRDHLVLSSAEYLDDPAYMLQLDDFYAGGKEGFLDGEESTPIYYRFFLQDCIEKGAVLISPGRTEAAFKYREVIHDLYRHGYSVYILDHRGQGLSGRMTADREMGYVEDFQYYIDDMKRFYDQVIIKGDHARHFLLAHSMGGAIGMSYLEQHPDDFDAASFSSPMLGLPFYAGPLAKLLSGKTVKYAPGSGPYSEDSASFRDNEVTGSNTRFQMNIKDLEKYPDARLGGATVQWVEESTRHIRQIRRNAGQIKTPFIIFSGGLETVVNPKGSEKLVQRARQNNLDCKLYLLEGARHEILMETDELRSQMLGTTLQFFGERKLKPVPLKISEDGHYLKTHDGDAFFWLGGTAWEMIHRLNRQEIDRYLSDRAAKGFTVIQTVILAELDGLNTPNAYGHTPLIDNDPSRLDEAYFQLVDYVVERSAELGMYAGLLPTWGDKFNKRWGVGPEIFNPENAELYGQLLARRYGNMNNVIWILGGDRIPEEEKHFSIVGAMARGIRSVDQQNLVTYHPAGGHLASEYFDEEWLDVDMYQSGHSRTAREYSYIPRSRKAERKRPVINGEARYENIRDRFWEDKAYGWLDAADVRVSAYWSMLAGAAGYTYGCSDIWQMYDYRRQPQLNARTDWFAALDLPGSTQMKYMKEFFETLPWQRMENRQDLILDENPEGSSYRMCAMDREKEFLVAYTPEGRSVKIDLPAMGADRLHACWFNPRSGVRISIGEISGASPADFKPWAEGRGSDFILLITNRKNP